MPPKQIAGRYDVVREVGRGGMGSVWLCTDQVLGREVALKQLGGFPGESSPQVARALREARSSAALSHPNVVAIFDAVEEGDHIWLVMEYLPSRTLSQVIDEDGALSPERAARIGAQVADGLAAAHARNTVHRDVKPGNILVTDDDHAKISDFGIARTLGQDQLTQTGLVSGTPLYFSPELARGATPSPAADVWALGATLFAAVEGHPPWPLQDNSIAMLVHIADNDPPTPLHAGPLAEVIGRMMTVDPDRRPTMAEVRDRLRSVATAIRTPVPPEPGPDHQATQVFPVAVPGDPEPTPATPAPAPDDRRRRPRALVAVLLALLVILAAVGIALAVGSGGDDPETPAAGGRSSEPAPSHDRSSSPATTEASPTPTPAETPEDPTTAATTPAAGVDDPAAFVTDYYALLPADTKTAWSLLSDSMQDAVGNYGQYKGFWATVDSVSVEDTAEVDDGVVDVTLTYVTSRGSETETRRITVADTGDGRQIVGDEVV